MAPIRNRSQSSNCQSYTEAGVMNFSTNINDNSYVYKTSLRSEEKNIVWNIDHFSTLQWLGVASQKITFDAGDSIGISSTWTTHVLFQQSTGNSSTNNDDVGLYFSLDNYTGPKDKMYARFDCSIKDASGTNIVNEVLAKDMRSVSNWGWKAFTTKSNLKLHNCLINDTLSISIKFIIYGSETINVNTVNSNHMILVQESLKKVNEDMQSLLDSGTNSDFTIKVPVTLGGCEYESFKVHRNILATRSLVFKAMFESPMKESQSGEVTINDLTPAGLIVILKFIYTGVVDDDWMKIPEQIIDAADRYSLDFLKMIVEQKLHFACNTDNAFNLLQLAKTHSLSLAVSNISNFIQKNFEQIVNSL